MDKKISFGTDGWRALMCDTFTLNNVRIVAQAIANYLLNHKISKKGVVIGYDTRFFSEEFARTCAQVFSTFKIPVFIGETFLPTPLTAFAVKFLRAAGGVMITASHNPPFYNGIKFIPEYAGPAFPSITSEIEKNIKKGLKEKPVEGNFNEKSWKKINPFHNYTIHLKKIIDFDLIKESMLEVIIDSMFGAGQGILERILEQNGVKVIPIHNYRDAYFGNFLPDPSQENLKELTRLVLKRQANLGLALDGDGDRFGVVDSLGKYLTPNQAISLCTYYLLKVKREKGKVVRTVATTHLLDKIAQSFGVEVIETPVGFKYIAQEMLKDEVIIGGEESGGLSIKNHIPEKDGILADLILTEIFAYYKRPLSLLMEDIYQEYGHFFTKRLDIKLPLEEKEKIISKLESSPPVKVNDLKVEKVETRDGVKLFLKDGSWILIRPSGTEPLVRVYLEASSKGKIKDLESFAYHLINY